MVFKETFYQGKNDERSERYSLNSEHISFTSFVVEVDKQKGERMRHWEYRTVGMHLASVSSTRVNGWRLKEINEQEQPDWKKTESYPSIVDFCNHMSREGWELISAGHPRYADLQVVLYFKRSYL
ncbi:MAG: hypothetical protein M3Y39_12910 [Chloroflexota bacterium]|nr:hypothetical protein [Chloroflexota bacterium]